MDSADDKTVIVRPPAGADASADARADGDAGAGEDAPPAVVEPEPAPATAGVAAPAVSQPARSQTDWQPQTDPQANPQPDSPQPSTPPRSAAQPTAPTLPLAAGTTGHQALPNGTRIAEFEIVGLIGEGGFGIVYLAWDTLLRRHVALKEYIPAALAARSGSGVTVRSERHEETFRAGLRSFINEAQLLAQFDHHSLVKVYRFWEANGTAYMVMPYYEGVTLKETLRALPGPPDETWLRTLLAPLLEALAVLHDAQCYHRDIAPDNIMLLKGSQRPLLLDFGAARRVIGDMTQALTVILKPGYAPVEQYAEVPSMKQGPWTDLYALAAVVYYAILGRTPPPAVGRLVGDTYAPLASSAAATGGRYSIPFLRAIDRALAVRPEERPQSVRQLADELGIAFGDDDGKSREAAAGGRGGGPGAASPGDARAPRVPDPVTKAAASGSRRGALIAAVVVAVVAVIALGGWFALRPPTPVTGGGTPTASTTAKAVAPAPPPAAATAMAAPSAGTTRGAPATSTTTQSTAAAPRPTPMETPPAALPPFTPSAEFDRIVGLADPSITVTTKLRSTIARIKKDYLQFQVTSNRAGYVYVFMVDPQREYLMLLPNQRDRSNTIAAGQTLTLPRPSWPMLADAPAGPIHFLVLVSPQPRDFSSAGLHSDGVFAGFSADAQRDAAARRTASDSPFAGRPRCTAGAAGCSAAFGAATFQIDVVN